MNRSLHIVRLTALTAVFGAALAGSALAEPMQAGQRDEAGDRNLARLADHIEIMRIIVAKSINEGPFSQRYAEAMKSAREEARKQLAAELDEQKDQAVENGQQHRLLQTYSAFASDGYWYALGEGAPTFTSHTRGFYAGGVGVIFTTEVSTPGRLVENKMDAQQQSRPQATDDDEWAAAAREAEGGEHALLWELRHREQRGEATWEIDPAYIDDAINGVIEAVGKHGARLTDLPDSEDIIVAIRFEGDQSGMNFTWSQAARADAMRAAELAVAAAEDAGVAAVAPRAPGTYVWSGDVIADWSDRQQHVVIQIPKSAVTQYAGGGTIEELRKQATITRYASGDDREGVFGAMAPVGE